MAKKAASKRKPNAAFMKPVQPDDKLAAVVGSNPLPRTELTKKLWVYIKKNKLQDAKKTQINADDALKAVFKMRAQKVGKESGIKSQESGSPEENLIPDSRFLTPR